MYKQQQQINQNMKGLVKNLEKQVLILNKKLATLPEQANDTIAPLTSSMNDAMRALKNGDSNKLSDILSQFSKLKDANTNK